MTQYFPPDLGGASTRAINAVQGLIRNGHHVDVITGVEHYPKGCETSFTSKLLFKRYQSSQLGVERFWMPPFSHETNTSRLLNYLWFTFVGILGLLKSKKPDIIFTSSPNFFCFITGLFARLIHRVPVVVNIDDLWPEAFVDLGITRKSVFIGAIKKLRNSLLRLANHIVCISHTIEQHIVSTGIPPSRVSTIEVGCALRRESFPCIDEMNHSHMRIVYSGVLGPAYNFNSIIQVAELCKREAVPVEFIIKGQGEKLPEIRKKVKVSELNNITVLDQWMTREDHLKFLEEASAFILPMQDNFISTTALPTKLFEYMASGKPVIIIGKGEASNLVSEAQCGITVNPDEISKIVEFIRTLIRHPERIGEMGFKGFSYIKENLSIAQIGAKFTTLFEGLVTAK
ncbi:MAG: glycosyltransferase family 4 protein [Candidatus Thorarchaeota archaeon]